MQDAVRNHPVKFIYGSDAQCFGVFSDPVNGDDNVCRESGSGWRWEREDVCKVVVIEVPLVEAKHLLIVGEQKGQVSRGMAMRCQTALQPGANGGAMLEPERRLKKLKRDVSRCDHWAVAGCGMACSKRKMATLPSSSNSQVSAS